MKYCFVLFVSTGLEEHVAASINRELDSSEFSVFIPQKESVFRKGGFNKTELSLCFPGYVFLESELSPIAFLEAKLISLRRIKGFYRLLNYGKYDEIAMHDDERQSLSRLLNSVHTIENSIGFIEGDIVHIRSGSLVGMESKIRQINRHKREAIVEIEFMGALRQVTVALEIIEKT